ncbi:MAG: hypothetical protein IJP89_00830 [Synergistaceae bacterium]|nr:hypothetical protein [Synergistaceae bacterium]
MKKFLLKISVFALYVVLVEVVLSVWIDPFNVFHTEHIRSNGIEPNKHYIKMKYILANPDKFDSFIFGSSRVGSIHNEKIPGEKCYNMTYSAGLPGWHLLNLKTFLENGVHPQKIYIGLDSLSYTWSYEDQTNEPMRCPYEYLRDDYLRFARLYIDIGMVRSSLETIIEAWRKNTETINVKVFYDYGWNHSYGADSKFDWSEANPSIGKESADIESALEYVCEIDNICRANDIELVLFTNPMHKITYVASVKDCNYLEFLEGLAEISSFWNFSSLNDVTMSNDYYLETSHYKAEVGDLMIDVMCNGKSYPALQQQGFGVKVTRENVKEFVAMLRSQAEDFRTE